MVDEELTTKELAQAVKERLASLRTRFGLVLPTDDVRQKSLLAEEMAELLPPLSDEGREKRDGAMEYARQAGDEARVAALFEIFSQEEGIGRHRVSQLRTILLNE